MRFGLNLVRVRPDRMPALAARAEMLGFESVFVPDHAVLPVAFTSAYPGTADGAFPYPATTPLYDPWIVLATIAGATTSIRLGTAVYILALRHPIVTARQVATLDVLSGGRVIVGVGVGWLREEFSALGIDPRSRFARCEEAALALRQLWTEPEAGFEGSQFRFGPVHFEPKPLSEPWPPLLFGGDSDAALRRAVRFGDGWMSGGVAPDVAAVAALVDRLGELRSSIGRHGQAAADRPFDITVLYPDPSAADLLRLAAIGVNRVVVMPWAANRDAAEAIERFAAVAACSVGMQGPAE